MDAEISAPHLPFADLQLAIEVGFWEELRRRKLTTWRLEEPLAPLAGTIRVNTSDRAFLTPPNLVHLSATSFDGPAATKEAVPASVVVVDARVPGRIRNFNFPEGLNELDGRNALLSLVVDALLAPAVAAYESLEEEERAWTRMPFCMLAVFTYMDAKAYRFYHKEAFPTVSLGGAITVRRATRSTAAPCLFTTQAAEAMHRHGVELVRAFPERVCNPFIARCRGDAEPIFAPLSARGLVAEPGATVVLCFFDLCDCAEALSLPARNLLTCLRLALPSMASLHVYALRTGGPAKSLYVELGIEATDLAMVDALRTHLSTTARAECPAMDWREAFPSVKVTGWRKKKVEVLHLGAFIDPVQRADSDARFNLELMKWRVLPSLELTRLANCKALLLGTGTLGCNVARNLLMWGVRHLTLLDRGVVSFSNLARQSLFTFEAARDSKRKVDAAAEALRAIIPSTVVHAVPLTIHMPGHRIDADKRDEALGEIRQLAELIAASDVVFLLTDSREARWMPTILAAASCTPVVNVALGFDTYVVMRHGVPPSAKLGCYFCSDVVAPTDSLSFRALDEQCTVTRPAVSSIASALAVELVAALYQHPDGFRAAAFRESGNDMGRCRLGVLPQQIRGSVFSHTMQHLCGERNPHCTACCDQLLRAYAQGGEQFLLDCVNAPAYIEEVCGVRALKEAWEANAREVCWSSDDEWSDS